MRRLLLLLFLPILVVAAPVPKEKPEDRMKRLFGVRTDAGKGYEFTLAGNNLTLTMEANASADMKEKTPPRVGREVSGDFEAQVTVTLPERVGKEEGSRGMVVAGLCVWASDGRYHVAGTGAKRKADGWELQVGKSWDHLPVDKRNEWGGTAGGPPSDSKVTHFFVRVKRDKDGLQWFQSTDGKTWGESKTYVIPPPESAFVGVCGINSTDTTWAVTFSDLVITPQKLEKK
jgi:hypothetical protein